MSTHPRLRVRRSLFAVLLLAVGCSDYTLASPFKPDPTLGGITVRVTTTGPEPDTNGYSAVLDDGSGFNSRYAAINGSTSFGRQSPGSHQVRLEGLSSNCSVADGPLRDVTVVASTIAEVLFEVECALVGLRVTISTTGSNADVDGYQVMIPTLYGGYYGYADTLVSVASNSSSVIHGQTHTLLEIELRGVAEGCLVLGANPVSIQYPEESNVVFDVECT